MGYTLDELPNYITSRKKVGVGGSGSREPEEPAWRRRQLPGPGSQTPAPNGTDLYTSACFEPTIDYCVMKIPRWTFEKFPDADETADHPDEVRRRGDGHRPDVQGGVCKKASGRWRSKRFGFGWTPRTTLSGTGGTAPARWFSGPLRSRCGPRASPPPKAKAPPPTVAHPGRQAPPQARNVPSQGRLYYLRYALQDGVDDRADPRADEHRSVVPGHR